MPSRNDYVLVARELKQRLNGKAFLTVYRHEVTEMLRNVSGESTTRIKSGVARELTQVLLENALRCLPSIEETSTNDTVRIFRAGTVFSNLIDLLVHPSAETDKDVGDMLLKIKGKWNWSTPGPGETLAPFE